MASLSLDERRAIIFGATSVYQRVAAFAAQTAAAPDAEASIRQEANTTLQNWSRVYAPGDRDAFLRRLTWDGLDWTTVAHALSTTDLDLDADADWTTWLDLILDAAAGLARELEAGPLPEATYFESDEEPPFVELAFAGVRAARTFLLKWNPEAYATFTDAPRLALERQLAKELALFAERTVYELFQRLLTAPADEANGAADQRYRAFIVSMLDDGLRTFWVAYPSSRASRH